MAPRSIGSVRQRLHVSGVVQGVGFRPHVYRLARELGLSGFVRNGPDGVVVEIEGGAEALASFAHRLAAEVPPLASIEKITLLEIERRSSHEFRIEISEPGTPEAARITPDSATCDECLRELFDPADRRYRYPFINCTNCGPRFTISLGVPWDRARTTMAGFEMCPECRAEYDDPLDRRFHAQPNACSVCGPSLELAPDPGGGADPLSAAVEALRAGEIVAIKGLGGFHLACLAGDQGAVGRLRERKHREHKPFAIMTADSETATRLVQLTEPERRLLESRERPIVLARRRPDAPAAPAVAPGHRDLGVFLPYTPLHHLLLEDVGRPLVMTSGNRSDEPIAYRDEDALERLSGIADRILLHDRPIAHRVDDSVVRVVRAGPDPGAGGRESRPMMLRRARGYVPGPVRIAPALDIPVFAAGAQLKSTFAIGRGDRAWVSPHIGDLDDLPAWTSYQEGVERFEALLAVEPATAAHDVHPDYRSTRYAIARTGRALGIQHHHAHLAAVLAEHGDSGPALGVIFDGTGYGTDGTVWGGEFLLGGPDGYERVGHLRPVRMPGGEAAIREPWRMSCAWLCELGADRHADASDAEPEVPSRLAGRIDAGRWRAVAGLARSGLASPVTTSAGRLFDAVSALCGIRDHSTYEGHAAIELENHASRGTPHRTYRLSLAEGPSPARALVLDPAEVIGAIRDDLAAGVAVEPVAAAFHQAMADGMVRACVHLARVRNVDTVVLSGGVFQNVILLEAVAAGLSRTGLRTLLPRLFPPNDGGISLGQLAVAAARTRAKRSA